MYFEVSGQSSHTITL